MVFQYQYQYQYQYQLQRGLGFTTYDSFSQIIQDSYSNPIILSLLVAIIPLIFFQVRDRYPKIIKYLKYLLAVSPFFLLTWLTKKYYDQGSIAPMILSVVTLAIVTFAAYEYIQVVRSTPNRRAKEILEATFLGRKKRDYVSIGIIVFALITGTLILTKSLFLVAVTSNSMAPTFWAGDLVLMQSINDNYEKSDIAVFKNPQFYRRDEKVIHRIENADFGKIRTKGDNNGFVDDWILSNDNILGSAVTFNEHPVVFKDVGELFIENFDPNIDSKPEVKFLRNTMLHIRQFGPMYVLIIILMVILIHAQEPEKEKVY